MPARIGPGIGMVFERVLITTGGVSAGLTGAGHMGMEMARVLKAVMITVAVNVASTASTVNTVSGITARTIAKDGRRGAGSAMATGVILGRRSVHAFTSPSCPIMCSRQISRRPRVVSCEPWEGLMRRRSRVTS